MTKTRTINERVADVLGVDRTVFRSRAEAYGWRNGGETSLYAGGVIGGGPEGDPWEIHLTFQEQPVHVNVPPWESLPAVVGSRDKNDRYWAHIGRTLAEDHPQVAAAIEGHRSPPKMYDTHWNATMDIRAWAAPDAKRGAALIHAVGTRALLRDGIPWQRHDAGLCSYAAALASRNLDWCHAAIEIGEADGR